MLTDEEFENLKVVLTIMMMTERLLYFFSVKQQLHFRQTKHGYNNQKPET